MKKNKVTTGILALTATLLSSTGAFAQQVIDIGETINQTGNSFIKGFGVIALVGLIIVFVWAIPHFTKDNGDSKKAWGVIIGYLVAVGIVIGVASALRGISL